MDAERFRMVAGNALAVSRPDYRIELGEAFEVVRREEWLSLPVVVEPQWAGVPADPWLRRRLELRQSAVSGRVVLPDLPASRIRRLFGLVGGDGGAERRERARALLDTLGSGPALTLVIEFERGMSPAELNREGWGEIRRALLSPRTVRQPLYWATGSCASKGLPSTCDEVSPVAQFHAWVSLLRPADDPTLRQFGLSLAQLRQWADTAKVYGSIEIGVGAAYAKRLLGRDGVKMVHVVGAELDCVSNDYACTPLRSPS
ncbi:hypothetical protein GCM10023259_089740 [Thermocatellispora tengchongensis]